MKIAVYCSSQEGLDQRFIAPAQALGEWIGENGHTLVYGGVKAGLMHTVAQATHEKGGKVVGVVPERFNHRIDPVVDEVISCRDLGDRKVIMMEDADAFVVLPGGIGTIDEWVSALSQIMVDGTERPIIVVNVDNMFGPMLEQMRVTARSPFARGNNIDMSMPAADSDEMIKLLNNLQNK